MAQLQKLDEKRQLTNGRDRSRWVPFHVDFPCKGFHFYRFR